MSLKLIDGCVPSRLELLHNFPVVSDELNFVFHCFGALLNDSNHLEAFHNRNLADLRALCSHSLQELKDVFCVVIAPELQLKTVKGHKAELFRFIDV